MPMVEIREVVATHVTVSEDTLSVELADGRTIAALVA
jgi:septum formation topological specificity factor MinE